MHRVIEERDLAETSFSAEEARAIFREMVRARRFDERALALQRRGWMSGYPPFEGQEASQVGAAHALAADDWLFPTYRANAMQLARGVPASDLLSFRRGHPEFASGHDVPNFPQTVPIATQLPHAVGAAMAADRRGQDHVVCCQFGDGATSEGDFHEALNFAGVFAAPVVFLCENNGWAISTPRERQTASPTIAEKARAYGFPGVQVDGNDPLAVAEMVTAARERALGDGDEAGEPVLVESLTYRRGPHTTSDDPDRYLPEASDLPAWRTRDPLDRFEAYLREQGVLDDGEGEGAVRTAAREAADAALDDAVETAEAVADGGPADLFAHVYAEVPPRLAAQREYLEAFLDRPDREET